MFFSDRIKSIKPEFKVLEIGPGSTPHPRANEFLEFKFEDLETTISQRGSVRESPVFGGRKVTYYNGDRFPFDDNQFDYVIASHVIEHTPDPYGFMSEVFRVGGGRGYLEFPLPPYEYLFDLDVHLSYVWFDVVSQKLCFVKKQRDKLNEFSTITSELRRGMELGWDDLIRNNLPYFIQGFEYSAEFVISEVVSLNEYVQPWVKGGNGFDRKLIRKVEKFFSTENKG